MTNIPLRDVGIAAYQEGDSFNSVELFNSAIPHPVTEDFPVPASTDWPAYKVVGVNAAGYLVEATDNDVQATGALTFSGAGAADETVTIGSRVYTLKAAPAAANQVKVGASAAATALALAAAINGGDGEGDLYGTGTVAHPDVVASAASGVVTVTAKVDGTAGNSIATTETSSAAAWGAGTLATGAAGSNVQAIGVTATPVKTAAGQVDRIPIYRAGNFNPAALGWHTSFATDQKKAAAFRGAPAPTNIIVRKRL